MTDAQYRLTQLEKRAKRNIQKAKRNKLELQQVKQQLKSLARRSFKPKGKQDCLVCGKYKDIVSAHHITPLKTQKNRDVLNHDYVWLCPTHHKLVHLAIDGKDFRETTEMKNKIIEISKGECYEINKHDQI